MIEIIFKDVGQGDSIFLKWKTADGLKYGVIDSNLNNKSNPILDEIKHSQLNEIDFIILSHLHFDHFSGLAQVLNYCIEKRITINNFYHTFQNQFFQLLKDLLATEDQKTVTKLFIASYREATTSGIIKNVQSITAAIKDHALDSDFTLKFLSPIGRDYEDFAEKQAKIDINNKSTVPNLNCLSSIVKITNNKKAVLLTADCCKNQLKRLTGHVEETFEVIQVPHHGSINNHAEKFWNSIKKGEDAVSLFSVGDVIRDKLPNKPVVEYFDQAGFEIESTNYVYGIKEHFPLPVVTITKEATKNNALLDVFSNSSSTSQMLNYDIPEKFQGDKIYELVS